MHGGSNLLIAYFYTCLRIYIINTVKPLNSAVILFANGLGLFLPIFTYVAHWSNVSVW